MIIEMADGSLYEKFLRTRILREIEKAMGRPSNKEFLKRFESKSSPGKFYEVVRDPSTGELSCDCPGWINKKKDKPRTCKHVREIEETIKLKLAMDVVANLRPSRYSISSGTNITGYAVPINDPPPTAADTQSFREIVEKATKPPKDTQPEKPEKRARRSRTEVDVAPVVEPRRRRARQE